MDWDDSSVAGITADPDYDGISNLLERAFGGNPSQPDPSKLPFIESTSPVLSLVFRKAILATDLDYNIEQSSDLSSLWTPAVGTEKVVGEEEGIRIIRSTAAAGDSDKTFLRLKVTQR